MLDSPRSGWGRHNDKTEFWESNPGKCANRKKTKTSSHATQTTHQFATQPSSASSKGVPIYSGGTSFHRPGDDPATQGAISYYLLHVKNSHLKSSS